MKTIMTRHALLAYFLIAFVFTWSFHWSIKLFGLPFALDLSSPGMMMYTIGLGGPLVGAIIVSALQGGGSGVRSLLAMAARWRFALRWYAVAILAFPAINLLNIAIFYDRAPPDMGWLVVVPMLIYAQLWVVIAEEFGWRGFALPRLQERYGSLGATLILGPIWAFWHFPMFFTEGSPQYSENVPVAFALYTVIITMLSIVFTMLYNRTGGSVLACMLLHAFINIAAFTIQVPSDINITIYLIVALAIVSIWLLDRPLFGPAEVGSGDQAASASEGS